MSARFVVQCPVCRTRSEVSAQNPGACPKCFAQLPAAPVASADDWGAEPPPAPPRANPAPRPTRANPEPLPDSDEGTEPAYRPRAAATGGGSRVALVLVGVLLLVGGIATAVVLGGRAKPAAQAEVAKSDPPEPTPRPEPARPAPKAKGPSAPSSPPKGPSAPPKGPPPPAPKEYVKLLTAPPPPADLSGDEVFRRLLPSSTLVVIPGSIGSGVLVDADKKLMVTNAHVVKEERDVVVFFPALDGDGNPQTDIKYYEDRAGELSVAGEVLLRNPTKDIALVRLKKVPAGTKPVALALKPAATGSKVYSIGNSGIEDRALWRLTNGEVRGRGPRQFGEGRERRDYMLLETDAPFNKGDSGGPVVNARGELVALVVSYDPRVRSVSHNIDLTEVRDFVHGYFNGRGETWREPDPPAPPAPPADLYDNLIAVLKGGAPADRPVAARRLGTLRGAAKPAVPALLAALDGADTELTTAVVTALVQIGAPGPGAERALVAALRSPAADARVYAARALATGPAAPDDALTDLRAALADPSVDVRAAVALALGNMGPKARPGALGPLLDMTGDANPLARAAAKRAADALGAPTVDDRPVLLERLKAADPRVRLAAFERLRPLGVTVAEARDFWVPLFAQADPLARRSAVEALGAPEFAPGTATELLARLADADPEVRAAAARAAVHTRAARAADRLAEAFGREADPGTKGTIGEALALVLVPDAAGVPVLRQLLKAGSPVARERAAAKAETAGTGAAEAVPELLTCADDGPTAVRAAALRALAAIGHRAPDAVPVVVRLFARDTTPLELRVAGIDVLAKCGGRAELEVLRKRRHPVEVLARICAAYESGGAPTEDARVWLIDQAETLIDSREAIAKAVVGSATNDTVKALLARTQVFKTVAPGAREQRYPNDYRKWVIRTLAQLKLKDVAADETRRKVIERLTYISKEDKSDDLRGEAEAALAVLK